MLKSLTISSWLPLNSKRHKWKGTLGNREKIKEMEMGFPWQVNFQGSWPSPHRASRSVYLLTNFPFTNVPCVRLIRFWSYSKGGNGTKKGKTYSKLAEMRHKMSWKGICRVMLRFRELTKRMILISCKYKTFHLLCMIYLRHFQAQIPWVRPQTSFFSCL